MFIGRIALVTGGVRGIGLECTKELLRNEVKGVTIIDINNEEGLITQKNLNKEFGDEKVIFVQADVSQQNELKGAFETSFQHWGRLDIVINNAGIIDESRWDDITAINCIGAAHGTLLGFEYMSTLNGKNGGVIVNISSNGALRACPFLPTYAASKSFVASFSRGFGTEAYYKSSRVKVLTVCPGLTETNIVSDVLHNGLNGYGFCPNKIAKDTVSQCKIQSVEYLVKHIVNLIDNAENGSMWVIEDQKSPYQVSEFTKSELRQDAS